MNCEHPEESWRLTEDNHMLVEYTYARDPGGPLVASEVEDYQDYPELLHDDCNEWLGFYVRCEECDARIRAVYDSDNIFTPDPTGHWELP